MLVLAHIPPPLQGLEPDTICYNTLIACMERCNQPDRALAVFEQMMVWRRCFPLQLGMSF